MIAAVLDYFAGWFGPPRTRSRYHAVGGPLIRRFELTASLAESGSATAKVVMGIGGALEESVGTFTVHDVMGIFSGSSGDRGYCVYMVDMRRWEIIQMVC